MALLRVTAATRAAALLVAASGCAIVPGFDFDKDPPSDGGGQGGAGATATGATGTATSTSTAASGCAGSSGSSMTDYRSLVLSDSPIAYYRLGETTGVEANDEVGQYAGNYVGNVMLGVPGAVGGDLAVRFVDGSVQLGDVIDLAGGTAFSLEAWINPELVDGDFRRIVAKRMVTATGAQGYSLYMQQDQGVVFETYRDDGWVGATCPPVGRQHCAPIGQFTHVVGTYDTTTVRLYVNGVQVAYRVGTVSLADQDAPLVVGALSTGGNPWNGSIDEVAIYGAALPADRVKAHFDAGLGCP